MRNGRAVGPVNPVSPLRTKRECLIGTRPADHIRASGHVPRKQAGHMTCTRPRSSRRFSLATRAPSTHGDNFARRYSVVTETRRRWSEAETQAVVAEADRPGVNISAVARRHGIKPSLLFRWRRLARDGQGWQNPFILNEDGRLTQEFVRADYRSFLAQLGAEGK